MHSNGLREIRFYRDLYAGIFIRRDLSRDVELQRIRNRIKYHSRAVAQIQTRDGSKRLSQLTVAFLCFALLIDSRSD